MKKSIFFKSFAILALALGLSSCVSQQKFDELQKTHTQTHMDLTVCNQDLAVAKSQLSSVSELKKSNQDLQDALNQCISSGNKNIGKLVDEINASNSYIKHLIAEKSKNDSLNQALSNKLKRSLDDISDEDVTIQVKKGVVFISLSDKMLYSSGSYQLNSQSNVILAKIAKIINDYKDYDVQISGHTDDVEVKNPNIGSNWELSALRAIAIAKALQNEHGVDPARIFAGGHSQYQPKASNGNTEGRALNRRTEILILPKLDEFMKLMDIAPTSVKP
ncbi:MAG: hypothetical protein C4K58_00625 [Flavobacteriaceae bacterium]|nr:MAG: hypothetical protein C4K58_00625 [Flavobacteriaceae bacterium]